MMVRLRDGSGSRDYKFVSENRDRHGNVRLYFRRGGHYRRLRETPGTDSFDAEYRAALDAPAPAAPPPERAGSLRWLATLYLASPEFAELGPSTRSVRRGILDRVTAKHGHKPYALMLARDVAKLRDEKRELPEAANARVKALRQLFKWALAPEHALATTNPARDVPYLRSKNPEGHHAWTRQEIADYRARHATGTKARLALDLFLYTGVRISDVIRLGPQMERAGLAPDGRRWLHFTEAKNAARKPKHRQIPILPALSATIDAAPSGNLCYLVTRHGAPFASAKSFGNWFKRRCREAGLPHCSAHGMRKAGAIIAVENGATHDDLKAIYGWETSKQVDLYTRQVSRNRLAGKSMALIALEQEPNANVTLSPAMAPGVTKSAKKAL